MKVYKESCRNCLLSSNSIVSPKSRKEIIQSCIQDQSYFICHKASMKNEDVCCKTFYDKLGHNSQLIRIAQRLNVVQFVDQTDLTKLPSHKEMTDK